VFLGYLYLDLTRRDGKVLGAFNSRLQPVSSASSEWRLLTKKGFLIPDGSRHFPSTALVCNFDTPASERPTLLQHSDLLLLFHELGHGIHELVSKTIYSHFRGTSVPIDFGEEPSQMFENFVFIPCILTTLSRHCSYLGGGYLGKLKLLSGERLQPAAELSLEIVDGFIQARNVWQALDWLDNMHLNIFDMLIHSQTAHQALVDFDVPLEFMRLYRDLISIKDFESLGQGIHWANGYTDWTAPNG
jgi:metallopeptidase MepB